MKLLRIKELLQEKKIRGNAFAEAIKVTPASVSNIINGNSFPKPELLLKMSEFLEIDIRDLFFPTLAKETQTNIDILGFVEYKGSIHKISSKSDLENLIDKMN